MNRKSWKKKEPSLENSEAWLEKMREQWVEFQTEIRRIDDSSPLSLTFGAGRRADTAVNNRREPSERLDGADARRNSALSMRRTEDGWSLPSEWPLVHVEPDVESQVLRAYEDSYEQPVPEDCKMCFVRGCKNLVVGPRVIVCHSHSLGMASHERALLQKFGRLSHTKKHVPTSIVLKARGILKDMETWEYRRDRFRPRQAREEGVVLDSSMAGVESPDESFEGCGAEPG